ncbi:TonB-dependent receptor [Acetobacter oeni]|uniref:TonB-dependent receptor n=1 Tax=Acetobacter oeni TaxID=304077 RepID=A0A511XM62_9PROT|nr:TonB-dependent receptor [Acetobacter oeni]MBB3884041.1 iron complex outermembrane receptor protein [Acetobacter oeni]NHO20014.1 TonB-dependent receptor [Acetobacter oeni]GBR08463.1 TonB-dependent receptor [Acetobacter oeni LMG 21952]GEN64028.1 TonB-dependent receptor [Acetobacter oeni]
MQPRSVHRFFLLLTCSTGLVSLLPFEEANAADAVLQKPSVHRTGHHAGVPAKQNPAKAAAAPVKHTPKSVAGGSEDVKVTQVRRTVSHNSENTIGLREMSQQVPGQNILKAVGQLPGVSYSSTDPLGIDTWGASIYMRGYFQNQLAMTLDGVPLNDQSYATTNGLNIANAWIPDDIARVSVSQGGGALSLPSNTNLGGSMQFFTSDPKEKAGATVSQGFGSYAMKRTYVRVDSGELNSTGTRFYAAYSRSYEKKYDGGSPDFMQQVSAKFLQPVGNDSKITGFFTWNNAEVFGYLDKSLGSLSANGWRQELLYPNYPLAFQYAAGNYPASWNNLVSGNYTQLYDAGQSTQDYIGGLNFDMALTSRLRWNTVLYAHRDISDTTYSAPGTCSPGTSAPGTCAADGSDNGNYVSGQVPISEQVWMSREMREGLTSSLEYKIARHTISTGLWFEHNDYSSGTYYFNEPQLGEGKPLETTGPYNVYGGPFATGWAYTFHTNTFQYHLQDHWQILDNLIATYGFKSILQQTGGGDTQWDPTGNYSGLNSRGAYGSVTSGAGFLPAVNLDWRFKRGHELYFDFSENMRPFTGNSYASSTNPSLWSVQDKALFRQWKKNATPERTFNYVLGYRYSSRLLTAGIDGYHVDDHNRLLAASSSAIGGSDVGATLINAKRASQWGMDAVMTVNPVRGLSITNSVSYNHFVYGSSVPICWDANASVAAGCGNLKGKKLDGYPSVMYKANLTYSWHGASAWLDVNYYSKRPYSLMNDTHVPAYWLANLGSSYDFGNVGPLKGVKASFMVYNLFNAKYISMMGENGFPTAGDMQSIERGAVREFFGTIKATY